MESFTTLATLLPLSLASGVNLYATILVMGLGNRLGYIPALPAGLEPVSSTPVLVVAGFLFLVEFLADKIQFVDQIWDFIHTVVRPLGAVLIATGLVGGLGPELRFSLILLAGGTALVAHSGKASLRLILNVISPAENVSNTTVSLAEDLSVIGLVVLVFTYPLIALGIAIIVLAAIILFIPPMVRWALFRLRAIGARLRGVVSQVDRSEPLPEDHTALLAGERPRVTVRCAAHGIRGAGGRDGYLSVVDDTLHYTFNRMLGRDGMWSLRRGSVNETVWRRHPLIDVLDIDYRDKHDRTRSVSFVFLKNRAPLVQRLAQWLGATEQGK